MAEDQRTRAEPGPGLGAPPVASDQSRDEDMNFSNKPLASDQSRDEDMNFSNEPVASDQSRDEDMNFRNEPVKSDQSRDEDMNFRNEPVKSDQSRDEDMNFNNGPVASDQSRDEDMNFRNEPLASDQSRDEDMNFSYGPVASDQSRDEDMNFRNKPLASDQSRDEDMNFRNEPLASDQSRDEDMNFRNKPLASDQSRDEDMNFRNEPLASDQSRDEDMNFRNEPLASDQSRDEDMNFRNEPVKSDQSRDEDMNFRNKPLASDQSRDEDMNFRNEPGASHSNVSKGKQPSCCPLCRDTLKDPVSTSCGHWFCRHCISSYWDQFGPPGDSCCPKCGKRPRTGAGPQTIIVQNVGLQEDVDQHKISLRRRFEHVSEGTEGRGSRTLLNRIFTELYITKGKSEEVNTQHEVMQLETTSKKKDTPIKCCDIFKALPDQQWHIRVVLTNGVAGVGKTFSVQKFTLDWAEGLENQDVELLILLSFRELNLIRDQQHSLLSLLHVFHPTLEKVRAEKLAVCKLLFIFDGLDESRLLLDFNNSTLVSDVTHRSSVHVLLTNLIQGNLLPSALIWITSRPAAANQIPATCVDRVTEVRGFTDHQKEEYFKKRSRSEDLSSRIISHIKTSRSLHIMCQIPVFCWVSATVLEHMLTTDQRAELPKTLTDMYSNFLLVQTKRKKNKYGEECEASPQELTEADRDVLLKLGRLAFEQLQKGNVMFYQEDLERCGLNVTEASVYSGVCTEIFRRESLIFQKSVFSFVHLSVQEFLAAVYMFHCFTNRKTEVLQDFLVKKKLIQTQTSLHKRLSRYFRTIAKSDPSLDEFLKEVMEKSLQSENGHLDLFVRFLHGLCLESNQRLLGGLLRPTHNSPEILQRVIKNLKEMNTDNILPNRCINIFHCLTEMKDQSIHQEIREFQTSGRTSMKKLSAIHCSALFYIQRMSEDVPVEIALKKYNMSPEDLQKALSNCREVWCNKDMDH